MDALITRQPRGSVLGLADLTDVFLVLENEGVDKFEKSWAELLDTVKGQLDGAKAYRSKIVTQVTPLTAFYPAEAYHQDYLARHPESMYIVINDMPKLGELRKQFPDLYVKR